MVSFMPSIFLRMSHLWLFGLCITVGMLSKKALPAGAYMVLNHLLLYVCLPAATLLHTSETDFNPNFLWPILMPWIAFGGSFVFFWLLKSKFSPSERAVLTLTAGIPSISFVGFPIFEALYGKPGLEIGVVMSQSGSFLVCSTLGVALASYYATEAVSVRKILWEVFTFPTFVAFLVALTMNFTGIRFVGVFREIIVYLSAPFGFLALVSVGLQMNLRPSSWPRKALAYGLGYKLLLFPLLIWLGYRLVLPDGGILLETSVIGAALGPMSTMAIITEKYGLHPTLAAQMVGVGIPLSLFTAFGLYWLFFV